MASMAELFDQMKAEIPQLKMRIDTLTAELEAAKGEVVSLKAEVEKRDAKMAETVTAHAAEIKARDESIKALEAQAGIYRDEITKLKGTLALSPVATVIEGREPVKDSTAKDVAKTGSVIAEYNRIKQEQGRTAAAAYYRANRAAYDAEFAEQTK